MRLLVIAILLTVTDAQQIQIEGPQNTLITVGSDVTLRCSAPSGNCTDVAWVKSTLQTNPETVFDDRRGGIFKAYRDRYSVNSSSGCNLAIKNVKLTDAGHFTCRVFISQTSHEKSAYIVIYDTQPKCAINASVDVTAEGDRAQLTCEFTYYGTDKVSMLWKGVKDAPAAAENGKTINQAYTVVASAPEVPSFTCVTSFGLTEVKGLASNIPSIACETPAIKILYPIRNVTLSPSLSEYPPGTNITCRTRGHPPSSFKWQVQELESGGSWMDIQCQTSNKFTVSNETSWRYRCFAMNVVRGKSYSATSPEFQVDNKVYQNQHSVKDYTGIGFGVGLLVAILLVFTTYACLIRLRYLEFRLRPANQPVADVAQPMKLEESPSAHKHSSIPSREAASGGQQEAAYASLGNDRDTAEYKSLEQKQTAKRRK